MPPKPKDPVGVSGNTTGSKQQFNQSELNKSKDGPMVMKPPITIADDPDVSELEVKLCESGKIAGYMLLPSDISKIWRSARMKDELVKFL